MNIKLFTLRRTGAILFTQESAAYPGERFFTCEKTPEGIVTIPQPITIILFSRITQASFTDRADIGEGQDPYTMGIRSVIMTLVIRHRVLIMTFPYWHNLNLFHTR